jgi:hypothetical protein
VNDHATSEGSIEDVIAASFCGSGSPLVDLTRDNEDAGPSGAVKDEPTDDDDRGKNEVDYRYFGDYYRRGRRVAIRFRFR